MPMFSRSLLLSLQRCVAVRQLTLSARVGAGEGVLSGGRCGFTQQRAWTSSARTACLQRLGQLQSAVRSSQYAFCTKAEEPRDDQYPPLPSIESDSEPDRTEVHVVQVKGLPWSCSPEDLLHFFSDCRIRDGEKGIHITMNVMGKPTGRGFVEFEHEEDVSKALEKHRQYIGSRYIEVYEVTDSEAEQILNMAAPTQANNWVVRLRGLPFNSTEDDITHFFSGLDIVANGITIVTDHTGRNSGEGFVQFGSREATEKALQRDREVIGRRYIEVFPSAIGEIYSSKKTRGSAFNPNSTASKTNPKTRPQHHHIHMRGLPFQVSAEDVVEFFSPLAVSKMLIEYGPDGKPSGDADVYFSCHQDATAAMSRDRRYLGERFIELFLNSVPESDGR